MTFLETLVAKRVINQYQIDDIMEKAEEYGGDIDDALFALNIDSALIRQAKSQAYNLPEIELTQDTIENNALRYIPEDFARHYKCLAFRVREDRTVEVGMVTPHDAEAQTALQFIFSKTNTPYTVYVISYTDFKRVMESYATFSSGTAPEDTTKSALGASPEVIDEDLTSVRDEDTIVEDSPIAKTVGIILKNAIEGGASDIHIEHVAESVRVRFRVDGELYTTYTLPKEARSTIVARIKILARLKLDEKRKPQDGRFYATVDNRKIDFRVSTFPTFFGEKVVIRILDPERGVNKLEQTGMHEGHLALVRKAITRPYGIILLTGPTGSGKSTTLYSMLMEVDREHRNVVSLEDPIEYNIPGVSQSQVHPEIDYTFATGLRSILRQDPDVIMVGEIRDKETAQLAIQAALTGHLVLATLHTNTAIGAIPRLIDMGVDPYLIAPTLIMTIAQRLVRRLYKVSSSVPVEGSVKMMIDKQLEDLPEQVRNMLPLTESLHEPLASVECPSGMKGRMGVFEVLPIDRDFERAILENPTEQHIYELARSRGMLTMKDDALLKCMQGIVPWSEVNGL